MYYHPTKIKYPPALDGSRVALTYTPKVRYEERYIAGFHFWSPSSEDKTVIKNDYDELMEMVATGRIDDITARLGTIMQLRPKAADGKALTDCPGPDGEIIKVRPRGFYMRRSFMLELLSRFMNE